MLPHLLPYINPIKVDSTLEENFENIPPRTDLTLWSCLDQTGAVSLGNKLIQIVKSELVKMLYPEFLSFHVGFVWLSWLVQRLAGIYDRLFPKALLPSLDETLLLKTNMSHPASPHSSSQRGERKQRSASFPSKGMTKKLYRTCGYKINLLEFLLKKKKKGRAQEPRQGQLPRTYNLHREHPRAPEKECSIQGCIGFLLDEELESPLLRTFCLVLLVCTRSRAMRTKLRETLIFSLKYFF